MHQFNAHIFSLQKPQAVEEVVERDQSLLLLQLLPQLLLLLQLQLQLQLLLQLVSN